MLLLLSACESGEAREWRPSDHQQPQAVEEPAAAPTDPASIAEAAAALYRARCAECHGIDGRGTGATTEVENVGDLTALPPERTDAELAQVIREGRGEMPAFGGELNERGIAVLVQHVRTLRGAVPQGE